MKGHMVLLSLLISLAAAQRTQRPPAPSCCPGAKIISAYFRDVSFDGSSGAAVRTLRQRSSSTTTTTTRPLPEGVEIDTDCLLYRKDLGDRFQYSAAASIWEVKETHRSETNLARFPYDMFSTWGYWQIEDDPRGGWIHKDQRVVVLRMGDYEPDFDTQGYSKFRFHTHFLEYFRCKVPVGIEYMMPDLLRGLRNEPGWFIITADTPNGRDLWRKYRDEILMPMAEYYCGTGCRIGVTDEVRRDDLIYAVHLGLKDSTLGDSPNPFPEDCFPCVPTTTTRKPRVTTTTTTTTTTTSTTTTTTTTTTTVTTTTTTIAETLVPLAAPLLAGASVKLQNTSAAFVLSLLVAIFWL